VNNHVYADKMLWFGRNNLGGIMEEFMQHNEL